jgi:hypothetical protein
MKRVPLTPQENKAVDEMLTLLRQEFKGPWRIQARLRH